MFFLNISITVKRLKLKDKVVERYFIYYPGFYQGICGGYGWKDLISLYSRFLYYLKRQETHFDDLIGQFQRAGVLN